MTATAAMITRVRAMVAEPLDTTYDDAAITVFIETYPLLDENGTNPTYLDYTTEPPTPTEDDNWIDTYDLNAAAADIWEEKAALVASNTDFSDAGASYNCSQVFAQYMKQARHYRSRRSMSTIRLHQWPVEHEHVIPYDLP